MTVVDLCCGDGWFTVPLAKTARAVTAVDIDGQLLGKARVRLAESGLTNCIFIEADAYDIRNIVQERVDYTFMANAFHGVPNKPRLCCAVHDVLKPGGLFAVVNWHARPRDETVILGEPRGPATELRMSPELTIAAGESGGLELDRQCEIPPFHYAVLFRRRNHAPP
jgi:ubiquinone/menaquinone biosynthesis C-methylase UbiE